MKKLFDDLWQTSVEHPFSGLNSHAYFLQRDEGNVLFYNTSHPAEFKEISKLGGISYQYLSHRHESAQSLAVIKSTFHSQLCADALEAPFIDTKIDTTFSKRQTHSSNIEIIPTPGHTTGGLCFYYESPHGLRYLFTGDTLFRSNERWGALVISSDGGSTEILIQSLASLRALTPDVVISSASVGAVSVLEVTHQQWHEAIDTNIQELSRRA